MGPCHSLPWGCRGGKPYEAEEPACASPNAWVAMCTGAHVTRFIGVAEVGNPTKQKSLHALALTPAVQMDVAELQQKPPDTTPLPYQATSGGKRSLPEDDSGLGEQVWPFKLYSAMQEKLQRGRDMHVALVMEMCQYSILFVILIYPRVC
jgi:hypothetical protein